MLKKISNDPYINKILKEFDSRFPIHGNEPNALWRSQSDRNMILDFILSALLTQRNEIKERIEGIEKEHNERCSKYPPARDSNDTYYLVCDCGALIFNEALTAASLAVDGEK